MSSSSNGSSSGSPANVRTAALSPAALVLACLGLAAGAYAGLESAGADVAATAGLADPGVARGRQEQTHPDPAFLVRPDGVPVHEIDRTRAPLTGELARAARRLREAEPIATIGVLEGPEEEMLGEVRDVALDDEDRVYVLDASVGAVRIFTSTGEFVASAGRPGEGPGELRHPRAVHVMGDRLLVADLVGRKIETWTLADGVPSYEERWSLELGPEDVCDLENHVVLNAVVRPGDEVRALHLLEDDGSVGSSFGVVYRARLPIIDWVMATGRVACAPRTGSVLFTPSSVLGEVWSYGLDGAPRWIATVAGYRPVDLSETERGGYRVLLPAEGFHRNESLTVLPPDHVVLQVGLAVPDEAVDVPLVEELHTYLIPLASGRGVYLGDDLPLIVAASDSILVTLEDVEFPELTVHALRGS